MQATQKANTTMMILAIASGVTFLAGIILNIVFILTAGVSFMEFFQMNDFGLLVSIWEAHGLVVLTAPIAFITGALGLVAFGGQLRS